MTEIEKLLRRSRREWKKRNCGIIATLNKGVVGAYPKTIGGMCRSFYFPTTVQGEVEHYMSLLGFGAHQYWLTEWKK